MFTLRLQSETPLTLEKWLVHRPLVHCCVFALDLVSLVIPPGARSRNTSPTTNIRRSFIHGLPNSSTGPDLPVARVDPEHPSKNHRRTGLSRSFHNRGLHLSCPRSLRRVSFLFAHPLVLSRVPETGNTPSLPPSASAAPERDSLSIHSSSPVYLALPAAHPSNVLRMFQRSWIPHPRITHDPGALRTPPMY